MSRRLLTVSLLTAAAAFVSSNLTARAADTFTDFLGVAAGDADASSAVVWTRASNSATGSVPLTVQYSTDSSFSTFSSYSLGLSGSPLASGGASSDYTAKTLLTGLSAGTNYFYRFTDNAGSLSNTGTFKTAPASNAKVAVRLGMSGDANGSWRPYTSTQNFQNEHLDAFVFLGDTIYETASGVSGSVNYSPAITFPSNTNNSISDATAAALRADMQKKYREQFIPVSTGSYPGLKNFFAAQGNYTLLDNHELGNRQYINGGAPAAATSGYTGTNFDTNTTGTFINQTKAYNAMLNAFKDYQPIRENTVSASGDARSDGTLKQYRSTDWGANVKYLQLDDRSYRDIRLISSGDDTGSTRGSNPGRTMLGSTQLQWVKDELLAAQTAGTPWKVISISSPIDINAPLGGTLNPPAGNTAQAKKDGGKSWIGGYRAERNDLLKFIADNHITNVVFLSTDDHEVRVNELSYSPSGNVQDLSTYQRLDRVYSVVAGPIGADGSGSNYQHDFAHISAAATSFANQETAAGIDPIGLDPSSPYLSNVRRDKDGVLTAESNISPADFYASDTFNYAVLNFSPDGNTLDVSVKGINSYAPDTVFPQIDPSNPVREVLGFTLSIPEPTSLSLLAPAALLLARRNRR